MSHLSDAQDLKNEYPEETIGFSIFEIEKIWEEHSEKSSAGWLIPSTREEVQILFDNFRR